MASSSRQKKKNQAKQNTFQGVLEGWFTGDEEGMNAYIIAWQLMKRYKSCCFT